MVIKGSTTNIIIEPWRITMEFSSKFITQEKTPFLSLSVDEAMKMCH